MNGEMDLHENWVRDAGLGYLFSNMPEWLRNCDGDEDHPELCDLCPHKVECEEYLKPLGDALERYFEIGEVY